MERRKTKNPYKNPNYYTIKRLDQSHLYPNLEVPRTNMFQLGIKPKPPAWEASTLEKSL
jgi:hypothetical protein